MTDWEAGALEAPGGEDTARAAAPPPATSVSPDGATVAATDGQLGSTRPATLFALLTATSLLRVGAVGTGIAVQFRLGDLAGGRPNALDVGLIGASQAVTEMVFAPILARFADRFGRRRFLVAGPAISMVAVLLIALGVRPSQLGAARLLEGLGAAAFVPTALGIVAAATVHDRSGRARASGAFEGATLLGYAGGIGLGSFAYFGLHRMAFVLLAGLYAIAAMVCLVLVPRIPRLPVHPFSVVLRTAFGPGPLRAFIPGWLAAFALTGMFVANLPALLRHQTVAGQTLMHHLDPRAIGLLLITWIVLFLVGIALWTPVVPRLGAVTVMRRAVPGGFLVLAAMFAINHVPLAWSALIAPFLAVGMIWLAGFGPAAVTFLADCSEVLSADRSALMSFYTVALAGGGAIGAIAGGFASRAYGIDGLIFTGVALTAIAYVSLGLVVRYANLRD